MLCTASADAGVSASAPSSCSCAGRRAIDNAIQAASWLHNAVQAASCSHDSSNGSSVSRRVTLPLCCRTAFDDLRNCCGCRFFAIKCTGGSAWLWLYLWLAWVCMHLGAAWRMPAVLHYLKGPLQHRPSQHSEPIRVQLVSICFHATVAVLMPLATGILPFTCTK